MLFPTLDFALFFLIVFPLAWSRTLLARPGARKTLLLVASLVFYAYWDWRFVGLLLFSANVAWGAGWLIAHASSETAKRWIMRAGVIVLLGVLAFFKYWMFLLEEVMGALARQLEAMGAEGATRFVEGLIEQSFSLFPEIILPIGVSFFTFQALSYLIDLRRGRLARPGGILDVNLYITFFPQLVAGPIIRAREFLPQLDETPKLTRRGVVFGGLLIALGLFKKLVISEYLAQEIVNDVFQQPDLYGSAWNLLGVYAFATQIYCDFSGYSDMAIGLALLMGYRFRKNFDRPYSSASFREFWRRWHISLSHWLRDYLYIELGGNRGGSARTYRNLALTMLLGGLWHGAQWKFVFWGAFHGLGLVIERVTGLVPAHPKSVASDRRSGLDWARRALGVLVVFHLVCLAWIFFRAESFADATFLIGQIWAMSPPQGYEDETAGAMLLALIFVPIALQWIRMRRLTVVTVNALAHVPALALGAAFGLVLIVISLLAPEGVSEFIYFQF